MFFNKKESIYEIFITENRHALEPCPYSDRYPEGYEWYFFLKYRLNNLGFSTPQSYSKRTLRWKDFLLT